jgi:hypothetical protein
MAYTYQFEDHLREHRPSRLGQRVWWMPAAAGIGVVIAEGVYLAATRSGQPSAAIAVPLPFIGALLFLVAWAALSIADWSYPPEKYYREAHHAAASEAFAYILAGRRTRGQLPIARYLPRAEPAQPQPVADDAELEHAVAAAAIAG